MTQAEVRRLADGATPRPELEALAVAALNLAALQAHPGDDVEIQRRGRPLSSPGLGVLPCPCNPAVPGDLRAVAPLALETC